MGRDKAFLEVGGVPVLQRALERLLPLTDDLFLVTNSPERYEQFGQPAVKDIYPGKAALGGIYTAICQARHNDVFVAACDMPFLNPALIEHLATLSRRADVVIPRLQPQPETLHALYSKACAAPIEKRLLADRLKVTGFFADVRVRYVERDEIARFDPQFYSFANMNTPEEWARLQALAGRLDAR